MSSIASVTPTICKLMGVEPPLRSTAQPIERILMEAKNMEVDNVEKVFIYAPDAIGEGLFRDYTLYFEGVKAVAPIEVEMKAVLPTYTPVCFSSIFTGAPPEIHGIRKYEKPVLSCDTIFDALARAGRKVALVSVRNSSIDLVFRNRNIDYYTEDYDPQVEERVSKIVGSGYDLIVAYHQEYDDLMHGSTPRDPKALEAFRRHLKSFEALAARFHESNGRFSRIVAFCPDHGTHIDSATGKGAHGTDSPEDVDVRHFWGIYKGTH